MRDRAGYSTGTVTSADGTVIGYRRLGTGPAVVLLHGGVNAAQHMMTLAERLADAFTVFLPDRRGRGASGPFGPAYSIEREDEDLAALVRHSGATRVFGPADGGLFALHGVLGLPEVTKVAAYEPLLFLGQDGIEELRRVFTGLQQRVREGRRGDALLWSARETAAMAARAGTFPSWAAAALQALPERPTGRLSDTLLRLEPARGDRVPLRELLDALPPELDLVMRTEGTLEDYRRLPADVLLVYGGQTLPVFAETAELLHGVLPRSTVIRLPGLDHDSAQTYGKPAAIADVLRLFFTA